MEYILLWLLLGLIGYCLLAYKDILTVISELEPPKSTKTEFSFNVILVPSKLEFLRGMGLALVLGPIAIIWFIIEKEK